MIVQTYKIDGITCPACLKLIERRIATIEGVKLIDVNLGGDLKIESDKENATEDIRAVLRDTDIKVI